MSAKGNNSPFLMEESGVCMELSIHINPELDVPIYRQLSDAIGTAIRKGELTAGQQLPTVQEVTESLCVARGTIKRAYDELERSGLVEKVQGRGTFVRYQPASSGSRKEQAIQAIDAMLDQLEGMGLSMAEISIFLNLKLRERADQEASVKVAVVECNPENLSQMSAQLRRKEGVDLYAYPVENVRAYPYQLEDFDLIVTTAAHAGFLEGTLSAKKRIAQVALRPSPACLSRIIKLRGGTRLGIIGYSLRFAQLLHATCQAYAEGVVLGSPITGEEGAGDYLQDKDAVLVPESCERYFAGSTMDALHRFSGERIDCRYEMDEGSLLYLEAKIQRIREEKTI